MKNKNGLYIGAIIILTILLIGILAMIVMMNKKEDQTNKKTSDNDPVEINHYNYDASINEEDKEIAQKFDDKYEEYRLLNINMLTEKIEDFNNLTNDQKLSLVGNYYDYYLDIDGYSGKTFNDQITPDDFTLYYQKVFGKEITFENNNLLCDKNLETDHCHVLYNDQEKSYHYDEKSMEHERDLTNEYYSKLIDVEKENNRYTLTYLKIFGKIVNGSETNFYDHYNFNVETDKEIASKPKNVDGYEPTQVIYEAINDETDYSKYAKYVYTIELVDDEIYLVGYQFMTE